MLSISFKLNVKDKFYILMEKNDKQHLFDTINMIDNLFDNLSNKTYFFAINGIDTTLDNLLEEVCSRNYVLIDNGKHNRFVKNLPDLYLFTTQPEDIDVFKSYIGAFSEGFMSLFVINSPIKYVFSSDVNKDDIMEFVNKYSIVKISVTSDKNTFEIQSNSQDNLLKVCNKICEYMLLKD